jgi:hypothetical protein
VRPSAVASSIALSVFQPSTIVRFMSHIPAALPPRAQWMNAGWTPGVVIVFRNVSTTAGAGAAGISGRLSCVCADRSRSRPPVARRLANSYKLRGLQPGRANCRRSIHGNEPLGVEEVVLATLVHDAEPRSSP